MKRARLVSSILLAALLISPVVQAENWPHWRGPSFNGSSPATDLPTTWSMTENIAWSADLPGASAATPIVWGDHVFVSSTDATSDTLKAMCFDRKTGKLLWQHDVASGSRQDTRSNYASNSPTTDGKLVVFFYGNGELVAFDYDGKQLWRRNIQDDYGPFAFLWTFSSSPVLHDGTLYLQVLQRDVPVEGRGVTRGKPGGNESYLLAMDPQTGKALWRKKRESEAVAESREAFTTPVPVEVDGQTQLVVAGGDDVTGHDPETGEELWRWGTWNPGRVESWRLVPSPVAGENIILVCAPKREPVYAIKPGDGKLDDTAVAWVSDDQREITSDVPTPAYYDGSFFILSDLAQRLSRVEPETGKVIWSIETPGRDKYEASPTVADGKIYIINFVGDVVVIDAEDGKILHQVSMDTPSEDLVRSSIAVADGQLFIRTNRKLYCVGK